MVTQENIPTMGTVNEVVQMIPGLSADALYKMIHAGEVTYVKIGKKFLLNVDLLVEYLNNGGKA